MNLTIEETKELNDRMMNFDVMQYKMPENNTGMFVQRMRLLAIIVFVINVAIGLMLKNLIAKDDPTFLAFPVIVAVVPILFFVYEKGTVLKIPEEVADGYQNKHTIAQSWATVCGIAMGIAWVLGMIAGFILFNGQMSGDVFAGVLVSSVLLGGIHYFYVFAIALLIAPSEYCPWTSRKGFDAFLRRRERREIEVELMRRRMNK